MYALTGASTQSELDFAGITPVRVRKRLRNGKVCEDGNDDSNDQTGSARMSNERKTPGSVGKSSLRVSKRNGTTGRQ